MVLIGIIFSFAVLSLGGDKLAERMEQETQRLLALIDMARDEAVLRDHEMAILFSRSGYEFLILQGDTWRAPMEDDLLKPRSLPAGIRVRLEVEGDPPSFRQDEKDSDDAATYSQQAEEANLNPQVFILSSGEITPFTATLWADQSRFRYHLIVSMLGDAEIEPEEIY
jgi:general secretion pathway protein H